MGALLVLPLDDRPGGCIEGGRPGPVPFTLYRGLPVLDVLPLQIQDLGLSHARIEGEFDQVREGLLERAGALPGADLPADLEDGLGLLVGEGLDGPVLPEELHLLDGIRALVDLPIDRLVKHPPEELHIPIERGLAAGPVDLFVANLDLPSFKPGPQLFEVVGRDVREGPDIVFVEELEDLLHAPGFLVRRGRLRVPGPAQVLKGESVDIDARGLRGPQLTLDLPGLLEGQAVLTGLE